MTDSKHSDGGSRRRPKRKPAGPQSEPSAPPPTEEAEHAEHALEGASTAETLGPVDLPATEPPPAAIPAGRDRRARQLARRGFASRCALLGRPLDLGARAAPCDLPMLVDEDTVSSIGASMLAAGVTPEELEHAAAWLRAREG